MSSFCLLLKHFSYNASNLCFKYLSAVVCFLFRKMEVKTEFSFAKVLSRSFVLFKVYANDRFIFA